MITLDIIKALTKSLPSRDINLALSFIDKREFEPLLDLIKSDITLVEKNLTAEVSNPMYEVCVLAKIIELQEWVTEYVEGTQAPITETFEDYD